MKPKLSRLDLAQIQAIRNRLRDAWPYVAMTPIVRQLVRDVADLNRYLGKIEDRPSPSWSGEK